MRTAAILPVKSFGTAKQRLGGLIEPQARDMLARAMLSDVLAALAEVEELEQVIVVTANPLADALADHPGLVVLRDEREDGQSAAALIGMRHASEAGFGRALLVPGDTPLLDPDELAALLARSEDVVIVPDRHGSGTNAILMRPIGTIDPAFGPGSRARHEAAASAAGVVHAVDPLPSLVLDVDTPDDLHATARALDARRGGAPATREVLRRLYVPAPS